MDAPQPPGAPGTWPPPPQQSWPQPAPPARPYNRLAVGAFASVLLFPLALVLGIVALARLSRAGNTERGRGLAIAALAVAGAEIAAEQNDLEFQAVETAPGQEEQAGAIAAILDAKPDLVILGTAPTETAVIVGQTRRDDLEALVGRPGSQGVLTGSSWYYVGSRWEHYAMNAPREIDRQVVAISCHDQ